MEQFFIYLTKTKIEKIRFFMGKEGFFAHKNIVK